MTRAQRGWVSAGACAGLLVASASAASPRAPAQQLDWDGYLEAYSSYNFNRPANRTTNLRAFDSTTESFALSIVALGMTGTLGPVSTRIVLQYGPTPLSYYSPNDRAFAPIQEAYARWATHPALVHEVGLFLSPLGLEALAPKDEWNWSRSLIWTALPGYHFGARSTYALSNDVELQVGVYNGWNAAIDNNDEKSVAVRFSSRPAPDWKATLLYFGGVERARGAAEGRPWRHAFDAALEVGPWRSVSARLYSDCGFEQSRFGRSGWASGALYVRSALAPSLFVAARAEVLREWVAHSSAGAASAIFWGAPLVHSQTLTADYRPEAHVSVQFEYRHDGAGRALFYRGHEGEGGATQEQLPTARSQDTLTLGVTTWF